MFGVSDSDAQGWLGEPDIDEDCLVEKDNWQTLEVFLAMSTQWRIIAGMSGATYQGLEYSALREVWNGLRIPQKERPDIFQGLRAMESAALPILNKRGK